jgi:hypothetical protein
MTHSEILKDQDDENLDDEALDRRAGNARICAPVTGIACA